MHAPRIMLSKPPCGRGTPRSLFIARKQKNARLKQIRAVCSCQTPIMTFPTAYLVKKDLWVDETSGLILDAQKTFYLRRERPSTVIDLEGISLGSPGLIDTQINGAYGFDFSVYEDDEAYRQGLQMIAERIVETGTQEKSKYPKLLSLLKPFSTPVSATFLGWHAEGPFIDLEKRGAHTPGYLLPAAEGFKSFEDVYGAQNLVDAEDWSAMSGSQNFAVRLITAAPEIPGRGIAFAMGHSAAHTVIATEAVLRGARLITHLFNAMPQLHHRDPSIIGLLGASPHLSSPFIAVMSPTFTEPLPSLELPASSVDNEVQISSPASSEALDASPKRKDTIISSVSVPTNAPVRKQSRPSLHLEKGQVADMAFDRPYYGIIVDGIHVHPNSVRLAYSSHPDGCILITDAMKVLDPHLKDGIHEWRDGRRFVKEGDSLFVEGTRTLAGSVVTLDTCVRNFSRFTGCSLGEAIKCATYNPAKCLGIEDKKGTLRPGAHADLIMLDRQGVVHETWIKGKKIWSKSE
ncbi:carbohydrate esterase family 9 protein [Pholiota molesta]|nr:carbohydrate esterase family 9 protein [Pholiota molesta]